MVLKNNASFQTFWLWGFREVYQIVNTSSSSCRWDVRTWHYNDRRGSSVLSKEGI